MPIYSNTYTCPANSEKTWYLDVEGDVITFISLRFPPGPEGELKVKIMYGLKSLAPIAEDQWLNGDDEVIAWNEYIELPEKKTTLKIVAKNEDTTYDHSFILRIVVLPKHLVYPVALINRVYELLERFLSALVGGGRRRRR